MLDINSLTEIQLKDKLMYPDLDYFEGMSDDELLTCINLNPSIVLYLSDEQLKPEILATALSLSHHTLNFFVPHRTDSVIEKERAKFFNEEVVKLIYRKVGMTFFYSAYKNLREIKDKTFIYRAIDNVKTEIRKEAYIDFCEKHDIDQNDDTYNMFKVMYDEKQNIIDDVMEMADYYTHSLCKYLKDDYEISSGVSMLYQGQTFANILHKKAKEIVLNYAEPRYRDNIKSDY